MNTTRGQYDEIVSLDQDLWSAAKTLVERAANASHIDEHGNWNFGAAFDRKARGHSLNWDLYGIGNDCHDDKLCIVIQIRQFSRAHKGWFGSVRKNYFLIGTNEDETTFAHSVSANVVRAAINHDNDVIYAIQTWMFGCDYSKVIRQGDMALVPVRSPKGEPLVAGESYVVVAKSHKLLSLEMRRTSEGEMYAKNPTMIHVPGTHPVVRGNGWFKLAKARRADFWKFSAPTID